MGENAWQAGNGAAADIDAAESAAADRNDSLLRPQTTVDTDPTLPSPPDPAPDAPMSTAVGPTAHAEIGDFELDRREVRCKVCRLPDDLRELAKKRKFEDSKTNAEIAIEINDRLERSGNALRVSAKNFSDHFGRHGTSGERIDYGLQALLRGSRGLRTPVSPKDLIETLRNSRMRDLIERAEFVVESQSEIYEDNLVAYSRMKDALEPESRARASAGLVRSGKALIAGVEALRRMGDPDRFARMAHSAMFDAFLLDVVTLVRADIETLASTMLTYIPAAEVERVRNEAWAVVTSLATSIQKLATRYRDSFDGALTDED